MQTDTHEESTSEEVALSEQALKERLDAIGLEMPPRPPTRAEVYDENIRQEHRNVALAGYGRKPTKAPKSRNHRRLKARQSSASRRKNRG